MSRPATRLLAFLELLESRASVTARDAAAELDVDARTIRRYVTALEELGIPVEGQRGAGGGYRLRPGHRLPPLMLADDEAAAVVFGLVATQRLGLATADAALGKVLRVLPLALRRRVEALESAVGFTARRAEDGVAPAVATLLVLAEAAARRRRVTLSYTTHDGTSRARELEPLGLVVHGGRWYAAAREHGDEAVRTYRVDRMADVALGGAGAAPAPARFDPVAHVTASLARVPWRWAVDVTVQAPAAEIAERLPATIATLEPAGDRTRVLLRADDLRWAAAELAGLGRPFTIAAPAELRIEVERLATTLQAAARA